MSRSEALAHEGVPTQPRCHAPNFGARDKQEQSSLVVVFVVIFVNFVVVVVVVVNWYSAPEALLSRSDRSAQEGFQQGPSADTLDV
jgi:hypothetical protein